MTGQAEIWTEVFLAVILPLGFDRTKFGKVNPLEWKIGLCAKLTGSWIIDWMSG